MEIIKINLEEKEPLLTQPAVACIGFFDGLHKKHEEIMRKTKKWAKKSDTQFVIITFDRKIRDFFNHQSEALQSLPEKYQIINKLFMPDVIFEIMVKTTTVEKSSAFFMGYLKNILHVQKIIVGSDFRFGKNAEGSVTDLKTYFGKHHIKVLHRSKRYSTSEIKKQLKKRNIKKIKKITKNLHFNE